MCELEEGVGLRNKALGPPGFCLSLRKEATCLFQKEGRLGPDLKVAERGLSPGLIFLFERVSLLFGVFQGTETWTVGRGGWSFL